MSLNNAFIYVSAIKSPSQMLPVVKSLVLARMQHSSDNAKNLTVLPISRGREMPPITYATA